MKLKSLSWEEFATYLFIEKKMSESETSVSALKSRFRKVTQYFSDRNFNKINFNIFIAEEKSKGRKPSQLNNLIKMAKHLDKYLKINELQDYSYFPEDNSVPKDVLSVEEIRELAEVNIPYRKNKEFVNLRQKILILMLGSTGMRIGEVLSIRWDSLCTTTEFFIQNSRKPKMEESGRLFSQKRSISCLRNCLGSLN